MLALFQRRQVQSAKDFLKSEGMSTTDSSLSFMPYSTWFRQVIIHMSVQHSFFLGWVEISRRLLLTSEVTSSWRMLEQLKTFKPDCVLHSKKCFSWGKKNHENSVPVEHLKDSKIVFSRWEWRSTPTSFGFISVRKQLPVKLAHLRKVVKLRMLAGMYKKQLNKGELCLTLGFC